MSISIHANTSKLDLVVRYMVDKEKEYIELIKGAREAINALQKMCAHDFREYHIGGHNNEDVDVCIKCGLEK